MSAKDFVQRGVGKVIEATIWTVIVLLGVSLPFAMKIRDSIPGFWGLFILTVWGFLIVGLAANLGASGAMFFMGALFNREKKKLRNRIEGPDKPKTTKKKTKK